MRTIRIPLRPLALIGLATAGLVTMGGSAGQAADPFIAGGRSTRTLPATPDQLAQARSRGALLAAALGMPGVTRRVERLDDRFEHRAYDEVSSFDAAGREVAIARFGLDGSVQMAVTLGWRGTAARGIEASAVASRAAALARAAGLTIATTPEVQPSSGGGGWSVAWPRRVDGVAVRGDGLRLMIWPDGSFHGLSLTERPLAAAPSSPIDRLTAESAARTVLAARVPAAAPDLAPTAAELVWVAANDTFAASRVDAPAERLRLAWAVRFESRGALVDRLHAVEVWIDAGDGQPLGGDIVQ